MKKINLRQFVKMKRQASSLQTHIQLSSKDSGSYKLYLSCDKLPLDIFIDCLIDNDFTGLIISGSVPDSVLAETWNKIYVQYCELSQSPSFNEVFTLTKKIEDLRAKIHIVDLSVKLLYMGYDKEIVEVINSLAIICDIGPEDNGQVLIKKLNFVIAQMKVWFPELNQKQKELDEIRSKNTGKTDRAYFDNWLELMSEVKGYQIEAGKITVSRFCRNVVKISEKAVMDSAIETAKNKKYG